MYVCVFAFCVCVCVCFKCLCVYMCVCECIKNTNISLYPVALHAQPFYRVWMEWCESMAMGAVMEND